MEVMDMKKPGFVGLMMCYLLVVSLTLIGIFGGERAVSVLKEQIPVNRPHTIIIDAGHGGEDGGATSCTGRLESSYNLDISLRLEDLMQLLGYRTIMIRRTDTAIYKKGETISQKKVDDLKERVRISNSDPGNVLLSIHQNFFSQGQYSGAQVFYAANEESKNLANTLQQSLVEVLNPGSKRKTKAGKGIYLLEKRTGCGVLIECGFLSNPKEESLLRLPQYQKKLACVIAAAVASNLS